MTVPKLKFAKTMVPVVTSAAAMFLSLSAGQALGASCADGSVDGLVPRTAMRFGTMVPNLPAFHYSDQASADLAPTMENPTPDPAGTDRGTRDDSATLPAEYTYLGQFIDHNLDFDETAQATADVNANSDHKHLLVSGILGTPQWK